MRREYLNARGEPRSFSIEQAQDYMVMFFFKNNKDVYGKDSYYNFLQTIEILKIEMLSTSARTLV